MDAAYQRLYIPGSKTGFIYSFAQHAEFVKMTEMITKQPPKLLKDRFILESMVFAFPGSHALFEVFDRKLQQYIEADLINYNTRKWQEDVNRKMYKSKKEPFAVLTLEDLEAGFVVSLAPLIMSVFVFIIEWLVNFYHLTKYLMIFKKLFEMKEIEQKDHSMILNKKNSAWREIAHKNRMMALKNASKLKSIQNDKIAKKSEETETSSENLDTEIM